jgi:hypothetical protein
LHVSSLVPPAGNILISNLPGSPVPLYLRRARLEEIFPISTIPPDMVMNITVFSYDGRMFFGMIAGYDAMPQLQELRGYLQEALEALEHAVQDLLAPAATPAESKVTAKRTPARKRIRKAKAKDRPAQA